LENGRRPQSFGKWKTISIFRKWKMLPIFCKWKMTTIVFTKEDDLNIFPNGRRPQSFGKWKMTLKYLEYGIT
jgi:hypothetical protein